MSQTVARLPESVAVPGRPEIEIRLWQVADAPMLTEAVTASVAHLRPFMPWVSQEPLSADARAAMIGENLAGWADGGDAFYGVLVDGVAAGALGAHHRVAPDGLEIGYWLRPDVVGRGIMTAAVTAVTAALLGVPGITHVEIRMDEANVRSVAIPGRCGYRLVAREQRPVEAPAETGWGLLWRFGADPAPQT